MVDTETGTVFRYSVTAASMSVSSLLESSLAPPPPDLSSSEYSLGEVDSVSYPLGLSTSSLSL